MRTRKISGMCWMVVFLAGWGLMASSCTPGATVEKKERTIKVIGSAELEVVPNEFNMIIALQEYYEKGKKKKLEDIQQELMTEFDSLGVKDEDVTIDQFSAYDQWWWYYWRKEELMRSMQVTVKFHDIRSVEKMMTTLNTKGISNITTGATEHSDIQKLRLQVKSEAIKNAKEKAIYLLDGLDKKLGDVISIEEVNPATPGDYYWGYPRQDYSNSSMGETPDMQEAPQWEARSIHLRYEINAEFEIL